MRQKSVSGTSFLEGVLCTRKKSSIPQVLLSALHHNSRFPLVLIFCHWGLNHYGPKLSCNSVWSKKCKCQRNAQASEQKKNIVLGFPKSRTRLLFIVPPPRQSWSPPCTLCQTSAVAAKLLFHTTQSMKTRNSQKLPCEKLFFHS